MAEGRPYPRNLPSDELICLPFLDVDTTQLVPIADAELAGRGFSSRRIRLLRRLASFGLWYQVLAWEWGSLGVFDVFLGYAGLLLAVAPFVAMLSSLILGTFVWGVVPLGMGLLLLAIAWVGLRRRRTGSRVPPG